MSGPRILLILLGGLAVLLWVALDEGEDADVRRGLEETAMALEAVEDELRAFDQPYQELARRGLMLTLKQEHDGLRAALAEARARRLHIPEDEDIPRNRKLAALRELRDEIDELLGFARSLHGRVKARHEFITTSSPLLTRARILRDLLAETPIDDPDLSLRRESTAGHFAELEGYAKRTDALLHQNVEQGRVLGQTTLNGLKECIASQEELLGELGRPLPD